MKNILLMLVLANILYLMWGMYTEEEAQGGVDLVKESDLGPSMKVTTGRDRDPVASVGAVLGSGEPSALEAVVGRSCVTIGPFKELVDADSSALEYAGEGMKTGTRTTQGNIFVGHWVQIRGVADEQEASRMIEQLTAGGLGDSYLVRTEDEGLKISLGVFGDLERAEKIELEAISLNLPAEISERTREGDVHFVDISLPPGKGAGTMIERYGQERVLLRDAATCPQ